VVAVDTAPVPTEAIDGNEQDVHLQFRFILLWD
jgi:hypothetical protein